MQRVGVVAAEDVADDGHRCGMDFPFGFGGQAGAGPAGVGVGFVVADVDDGFGRVDRSEAGEGEDLPAVVVVVPVVGGVPAVGLHGGPAVGEPVCGGAVAAVVDEVEPFAAGDEPIAQRVRREQHVVAGPFAVEGEPAVGRGAGG